MVFFVEKNKIHAMSQKKMAASAMKADSTLSQTKANAIKINAESILYNDTNNSLDVMLWVMNQFFLEMALAVSGQDSSKLHS